MQLTHAERTARGASRLEQFSPGSVRRLNAETINIALGTHCALGQTFGSYSYGLHQVFPNGIGEDGGIAANGFNGINSDDTAALTEEWRKLIVAAQTVEERELVAV